MDDALVGEVTDLFLLHKAGGLDAAEFADAKAAIGVDGDGGDDYGGVVAQRSPRKGGGTRDRLRDKLKEKMGGGDDEEVYVFVDDQGNEHAVDQAEAERLGGDGTRVYLPESECQARGGGIEGQVLHGLMNMAMGGGKGGHHGHHGHHGHGFGGKGGHHGHGGGGMQGMLMKKALKSVPAPLRPLFKAMLR